MKKTLALLLALMLALCSFALAEGEKNLILYAIDGDPEQLDPTLNSYARSSLVLQNLFQGLYKLGPDGKTYIPGCAESYEVSEDGMTYTFHMKEGLMWSDGTPLTAHDFEYSWKRVLDPDITSKSASSLWVLKNGKARFNGECEAEDVGVKAIDNLTLVVETETLAPWFISLTATGSFFPVKAELVEGNDTWTKDIANYVSNGPFMLVENSSLDKLVMVKNPYYYGADDIRVDEVYYYIIADPASVLISYENGDLNIADTLDANARSKYENSPEYVICEKIRIQYWDFNCRLPEFTPEVRKAFAYAIDRSALLNACMLNSMSPVFGFIPSPQPSLSTDGSYRDVAGDMFTEDVALAQQLMADAGYPGGAGFPTVEIVCQNNDEQKLMAQILGEFWKTNLGIEYSITQYDSSTYWGELDAGNFSVARNGFTCDYLDPSNHLTIWTTGSNCYENGWDDPVFDAMVSDAAKIVDPAAREQALIAAEAYLCDAMPGMPVYTDIDDFLVKPEITGIIKNPIGHIYFEYAQFA